MNTQIYEEKRKTGIFTVFKRVIQGKEITSSIPKEDAPSWKSDILKMNDERFYKVSTGKNLQ